MSGVEGPEAVLATAGHVDHGKTALTTALTGTDTDRLPEERRRGLTIDLGVASTVLPSGRRLALVDVPGHERLVSTMLAGAGPAGGVLLVVAADGGWSAQTTEHVALLDALGSTHALVALSRTDLVGPDRVAEVAADVRRRLAATSLAGSAVVPVSAATGHGLDDLVAGLDALAAQVLAHAAPHAPTRLWVDRVVDVPGTGCVVTGTLQGAVAVDDRLSLSGHPVSVRGLQRHGTAVTHAVGPARTAVALRGTAAADVHRGDWLSSRDDWLDVTSLDVALSRTASATTPLPRQVMLHVGSAAVPAHVRPLGDGHARLRLARAVPLHHEETVVLRDPGSRRAVAATVVEVRPPALVRHGDVRRRVESLRQWESGSRAHVTRYGAATAADLRRRGLPPLDDPLLDGRHVTPTLLADAAAGAVPGDYPAALRGSWPTALPTGRETDREVARRAGLVLDGSTLRRADVPGGDDPVVRLVEALGGTDSFTVADVRRALGLPRQDAVRLLERLAGSGVTRRRADGTHAWVRRPR